MGKFIVTIYPNATDVGSYFYRDVSLIVKRIKEGHNKVLIAKIRTSTDSTVRNSLKVRLPSICFSGIFKHRKNDNVEKHSGLVAIDFDHLGDKYDDTWNRLINDQYTMIAFRSPSGDGIKLIIKIPPNINTHADSCRALTEYFNHEKLDEFKDIARVCFESYDPNIYVNYDSKEFILLKEEQKKIKNNHPIGEYIYDFDEIYTNILKWIDNKFEHYSDGNKHKFLVKISAACLRFGLPEIVTTNKLVHDYSVVSGCEAVAPDDIAKIVNAVYRNYIHTSGSAHFEKSGNARMNDNTEFNLEKIDITIPLKDVIYLDAVRDEMKKNFKTGLNIGETTHFTNSIDNHYRMKRGELTLFHGIGNHGKSTFLMQILLIKSVKDNYRWAIFGPEQFPASDFYDDLVHMYIGKNTLPNYRDQMSEHEYDIGMDFVKDHFYYIYPEDESPTPEYINTRFAEVIKKHRVDGCVIDPYNQLDNDMSKSNGREDLYLSSFLTKQKRFAQHLDIFMFIVSHPKTGVSKNADGNYSEPNTYDLSGGAMWTNKMDNIICIYRPFASSDKKSTLTKFISQKIKKQKLCGRPGEVECNFSLVSMRFAAKGFIHKYRDGNIVSTSETLDNPLEKEQVYEIIENVDFWTQDEIQVECPF